mmetsp:Transcript_1143/g.1850  ORF Transcript_1143/g.1850 Transcript_1143/m.1850 type:complete len:941 (+) Transcript_1143:67-2889(+)
MMKSAISASALLLSSTLVEGTFEFAAEGATAAGMSQMNKVRGLAAVTHLDGADIDFHYFQTEDGAYDVSSDIIGAIESPASISAANGYGISHQLRGDHVTGNMLFVGEVDLTGATVDAGSVYIYRGEFNRWSLSQTLTPPAEFNERSDFGRALDVDRENIRRLAVGCKNCNGTHHGGGTVYIYEPSTPDAYNWRQTSSMTTSSTDYFRLGEQDVEISGNTLIADVGDDISELASSRNVAVFREKGKDWDHLQVLAVSSNMTDADLYDETIVIGAADADYDNSATAAGSVSVFYPNTARFNLKPKGKPVPVQWSVQQVLWAPTPTADDNFGNYLSLEGDRMVVGNADIELFVFEREQVYGKWSLQQTISVDGTELYGVDLNGATILTSTDDAYKFYTEASSWDCLIVSIEDHFGDGWDTAQLTVDVPGGEKDYFGVRCDYYNPTQFRYCPTDRSDGGLYKFSVPDAVKAKFFWEIVWRVYEEKTGVWYTGNWDTEIDFHWDVENAEFTHRKVAHTLPSNITCKTCPSRPTATRALKGKDSTVAPTISPAPTLDTDVDLTWQWLTLETSGEVWFDTQHKGTSYYISDSKAHRLLSVGTLCPGELTGKQCWEDYPDGDYILRVGGALSPYSDTHTFTYCKAVNSIAAASQMIFRVENGNCEILSTTNADGYCANVVDIVEYFSVDLHIIGLSSSFGNVEEGHFAQAIADAISFVSAENVKVTKAVTQGSGTWVTLSVGVSSKATGIDFADAEQLEAFEAQITSTFQEKITAVLGSLQSEETNSGLHSVTSVSFVGLKISGSKEVNMVTMDKPDMVTNFADTSATDYESTSKESVDYVSYVAFAGYAALVAAVAVVGFVVFTRATRSPAAAPKFTSTPVDVEEPSASTTSASVSTIEDDSSASASARPAGATQAGKALSLEELQELVRSEDEALKSMLGNAPQI